MSREISFKFYTDLKAIKIRFTVPVFDHRVCAPVAYETFAEHEIAYCEWLGGGALKDWEIVKAATFFDVVSQTKSLVFPSFEPRSTRRAREVNHAWGFDFLRKGREVMSAYMRPDCRAILMPELDDWEKGCIRNNTTGNYQVFRGESMILRYHMSLMHDSTGQLSTKLRNLYRLGHGVVPKSFSDELAWHITDAEADEAARKDRRARRHERIAYRCGELMRGRQLDLFDDVKIEARAEPRALADAEAQRLRNLQSEWE